MKKQLIKGISVAAAGCLSVSAPASTLANWSLVNNIWNYTDDTGALTKGWRWIDSDNNGISKCYYFDQNGNLLVSCMTPDEFTVNDVGAWVKDGSIQYKEGAWASWPNEKGETKWYYQNADGSFVTNGWRLLDGNHDGISEYYYFDASGQMLETTLTPDGKTVNADGKMLDENGNVLSVETPNTKSFGLKSTGNTTLGTGLASGGSSGGGGGSSSGGSSSRSSYSGRSNTSSNTTSNDVTVSEQKMEGMRPVITTEETNDNSTYYTIADYRYGSSMSDMVSDKEKAAVEKKIQSFMDKYISGNESDFLKVEHICRYLTKNVSYDCDHDGASTKYKTAYEALCKGKAQCMGYADAFLQMATAVGLDARYVYSDIDAKDSFLHVYNLVCVEGEWLIVDPTNAFQWGDYSELCNYCVLMRESDLNEYGYIASDIPITVCYGTPEKRFAYDGPNIIRGNEIQTADGNPDISNYPDMNSYLDRMYCQYIDCENNADEIICYTGSDDKTAAEKIIKKLISYTGTNKKLAVYWDRITYDDAMRNAHEILDILHKEGYDIKISYADDYVLYQPSNFNYGDWELECIDYTHHSIWQIVELDEKTSNETEEVVEQHEEIVENGSNTDEVIESDNSNESDDENRASSNDTGSDDDKQDEKSDKAEKSEKSKEDEDEKKSSKEDDDTSDTEEHDDSNDDNSEKDDTSNNKDESTEKSDVSSDTDDSSNNDSENSNNGDITSNDETSNDGTDNENSGSASNDAKG